MNTQNETTTPDRSPLFNESNRATYCPEDNKLRLYVGRVPRDEYLKLRADGWVALPKQREAGQGDFAATWTPSRRDTALDYAGIIEDEDAGPEERAADRAERFSGYRDKRTNEATHHADRYDAQPAAHGFQDAKKAERAVSRHEKMADRAGDAWSKAEYWQSRTAGVISHALYKSTPGVRMGRIKTIEAELRKLRASLTEYGKLFRDMQKLSAMTDATKQTELVLHYVGSRHIWADYKHPRPEQIAATIRATGHARAEELAELYSTRETSLYTMMSAEYEPITGAEACALFFSDHREPATDTSWTRHLELRLAYENQMLAAAGGRLEQCEVLPGGKLGGRLIIKVSKSSVTKRATSCDILGPKVSGYTYKAANIPGTEFAAYKFDLERLSPDSYTPPTPESLAELKAFNDSRKAAAPQKAPCPLINPTDADAERLQAMMNAQVLEAWEKQRAEKIAEKKAEWLRGYNRTELSDEKAAQFIYMTPFKPSEVYRLTQAQYSAMAKGTYSSMETRGICGGGIMQERESYYRKEKQNGPAVCEVRSTSGENYMARRVIVLTDKPQKPFPAAVWEKYVVPVAADETETETRKSYAGKSGGLSYCVNA